MPMYNPSQRDDIADSLMQQRGASTFDYGLAGLGSAQQPMASTTAGPQLAGLPQTPAGGVPGSGLATAGQSNVQLPQQRLGTKGAMPTMGGLGQMAAGRPSPYPKPGTPWPTPRGAPGPIMPPLPWQPPDMT